MNAKVPEIYLQPGEVQFARSPAILKTVLGSCVGVTFWSPRLAIGALCHGVLPECPQGVQGAEGYRYVDFAIRDLTRQFEKAGVLRIELQVKVFGGGDVLPVSITPTRKPTVGHQNWQTALQVLHDEGLSIAVSDIGGTTGRAIHFHTGTGEVLLRYLSRLN
jgi:chemotaxis protein CheD